MDLFLGLLLLLPVVLWIASVSDGAAVAIFFVVVGAYLVRIGRRDHRQITRSAAASSPADPRHQAIEALDDLLANAQPIPLTDWVRVDPREAAQLAESIREATADSAAAEEAAELTQLIASGRPVPLTDQVRVDRKQAQKRLAALRLVLEDSK